MTKRNEPDWLIWSRELQSISQSGLTFCKDKFDRQRYERIGELAAHIMSEYSGVEHGIILDIFAKQEGYPTPKVDVRAAVFENDKLLLVREVIDNNRWTLPGGWADVNESPSASVVREVKEESGLQVRTTKLASVWDRERQGHIPPFAFHVYKFFFLCEVIGGELAGSIETSEAKFFKLDELPTDLSMGRVLPKQLLRMFEHAKNPSLPTDFD